MGKGSIVILGKATPIRMEQHGILQLYIDLHCPFTLQHNNLAMCLRFAGS